MATIEVLTRSRRGLFSKKEPKPTYPQDLMVSEAARLAMKQDSTDVKGVLSIVRQPHYDLLSPYFAIKLLDNRPEEQRTVMERLANAPQVKTEATQVLTEMQDTQKWPDGNTLRVDPKKTSRIAAFGPIFWREQEQQLVGRVKDTGKTPLLVAYSGLFALEAVVPAMKPNETVIVVLPKKADQEKESPVGYKLTKTKDKIAVDFLNQQDKETTSPLAVIDDTTKTGNTFDQVRSLFPNAPLEQYPIYVQPLK